MVRTSDHAGDRTSDTVITVTVAPHEAELAADRMWQWGVRAVVTGDGVDGSATVSSSVGADPAAVARALATLDPAWTVDVSEVDAVVNAVAPEYLAPTWYRPDMVCVPHVLMPIEFDEPVHVTVIDPGSAFGLGDHPTTRASMAMLAELLRATADVEPPASLLDVGCGTGALAILGAQLGVPNVRAIDIADAAVEATLRNMALNDVTGSVDVDTAPITDVGGSFDVIVANILAPTLIDMAADLRRLLAPDGSLIVSGILADRHEHVLEALRPLRPVDSIVDGEWVAVRLV